MNEMVVILVALWSSFWAYHVGKRRAKLLLSKNNKAIVWDEGLIKQQFVKHVFDPNYKVYICLSKDGYLVLIDPHNGLITKLYHKKMEITDLVMVGGVVHVMLSQETTATRLDKAELTQVQWAIISSS